MVTNVNKLYLAGLNKIPNFIPDYSTKQAEINSAYRINFYFKVKISS
jgi:hypothetical protein